MSPCLVKKKFQKSATVTITSNLTIRIWNIKYRRKKTNYTVWLEIARRKKLIAQFGWKSRDERFEPNKNENATVAKFF